MAVFDGAAQILLPDGHLLTVSVHATRRGEQWSGVVSLQESDRRLEQGDVCHLAGGPLGDIRVIITEPRGRRRYAFISMITPDPNERFLQG